MDSKKFFSEIRKIIKEEISLALNEKNKKSTELDFNNQVKDFKKMQSEIITVDSGKPVSIQDLLNETRDSMMSTDKTLTFTSGDAKNFAAKLGYGNSLPSTDINGSPILNLDPTVKTALTKNYSELMKVMKNKKSNKK